jgi:hypothetical protein
MLSEKNNWENVANANIRKIRGAEYEKWTDRQT